MNHESLWAPWRRAYLRDIERRLDAAGGPRGDASAGDFFAHYWRHPELDEIHHVIERDEHGMILLNRYPYAGGHLLVALGEARPTLLDYESAQRGAFWRLVDRGADLVQRTLQPHGINIGINQGSAAGAGVPEHLHAHLVPRWHADTNFITSIAEIRVIPDALERMASEYRAAAQGKRT